jgi:hypothetical protein
MVLEARQARLTRVGPPLNPRTCELSIIACGQVPGGMQLLQQPA